MPLSSFPCSAAVTPTTGPSRCPCAISAGTAKTNANAHTIVAAVRMATVELVWEDLDPPKALELTPDQVGTGMHTMFTLLVPANSAQIIVNGRALPGEVGTRVQAGFETTTAFLYFSETWVIPPEDA